MHKLILLIEIILNLILTFDAKTFGNLEISKLDTILHIVILFVFEKFKNGVLVTVFWRFFKMLVKHRYVGLLRSILMKINLLEIMNTMVQGFYNNLEMVREND